MKVKLVHFHEVLGIKCSSMSDFWLIFSFFLLLVTIVNEASINSYDISPIFLT